MRVFFAVALALGLSPAKSKAADEYWRTDGHTGDNWLSNDWNVGSANTTGGTGWTNLNNAFFTANSTLTAATVTVGNINVSASTTVTITQAGTVTLNSTAFNIGAGGTLTWTGQTFSASTLVTVSGGGTLNLGASTLNSTAGFELDSGTVVANAGALGTGTLTLKGGTLQSSSTQAFAPTSIIIGGNFTLAGTGNSNFDAATTIALGATTRTITNSTTSGSRQFRGVISGSAGAGLTFNGAGSGQLYIGNTANTFTGPVTINGGEVVFNGDGAFGGTTSITIDGGRLTIGNMNTGGTTSAITSATIASARNIFLGASANTSISISGGTGVTTYNGVLADEAGSTGTLVKQGAGVLALGGGSTYSGMTSINNGTVQLTTGDNRLPTGTVVNLGQSASSNLGILDLNGHNQTIAGLVSTAGSNATASTNAVTSAAAATLTINTASGNTYTYSTGTAANSGVISGAVSLVKTGAGTQILGGANSYTGTTQINGGTLTVAGSLTGTGAVTLNNANSTLSSGTTGSIAGAVTANSGTLLTPGGTGTVGALTLSGGLTMNGGSTLNVDILGASSYDSITTAGVLTLGSGIETINISGSGFSAGTYTLISGYTSVSGGSFTLGTTPGGFHYSLTTGATSTTLTVSNGGSLTWSLGGATPSPASDGSGTWSNGSGNFYNTGTSSSATWDNSQTFDVTFGNGGAGGLVTLGSNIVVGGVLIFNTATSPYTIGATGGTNTLQLAGGITANHSATINAPTILAASQSWNVASGATLTVNGVVSEISGAKTLTKSGTGTLVLTGINTYTGGTVIAGGILSISSDANLGAASGGLTFNGGTLQTSAGITSARTITLMGAGTFDTNSFDSTLSGAIGGAGSLTKTGLGTLTISNANNNYSGGTTINGGALSVASGSSTGGGPVTINSGGTLAGAGTVSGAVAMNGGAINGAGLKLKGAVTFNGSGNALSGTTTSSAGTNLSGAASVTASGLLTATGSASTFSITGNNATLTNLGEINQTGTGRVIRDNIGVTGLVINNGSATNSTAIMQAADADVIQMNKSPASVVLNNYGTMTSFNASAGGSQVVDFNAILSGSNIVNNFSTGVMLASEADAVRPGVNGIVNNDGLIKSTTATGSSSDGIDAQTNSGIVIVNAASAGSGTGTGMIEGARHGITGGNTTGTGAYTMSITNNLGGVIQGDNGAGINIDGFNGNEVVTIVNHGTIIGHGVTGDGDGVDVDGVVHLINTGTIKSLNAFTPTGIEFSEGVTVGGGTIINSGIIEGSVTPGNTSAIGRGITIAGVDKDSNDNPIPPQGPYAATTIINSGLIKGDSDSAIIFSSPAASGFSHTITNLAGGVIQTGSLTAPAILTSADNVTINNFGTIDGSSSGKAITMGSGNNTVNILGGAASILGNVNGGSGGKNSLVFDVGSGGKFSYAGSFSNFSAMEVRSGTVELSGVNTYTGSTTVTQGALYVDGSIASANTNVMAAGLIGGHGAIGGNLSNSGFVSPGNSPGALTVNGNYTQTSTGTLIVEIAGLAASQHDLLKIGGSATLGGTLDLVQLNNFHLSLGDKLTFLTATGGIIGKFSTIINPFFTGTLVGAQLVYVGNEIEIEGAPTPVKAIPNLSPNQNAVAKALDAAYGNPRNARLISHLYSESVEKVINDLDRISPDQLTSVFQIAVSQSKVQTFNLQRRLEDVRAGSNGFSASGLAMNGSSPGYSGPLGEAGFVEGPDGKSGKLLVPAAVDPRLGVFVTGTGEWVNVDSSGNARGYDLTNAGFTLGLDYKCTDHFVIGLAAGYDHSNSDLADNGRLSVDGGKIALYSSYFTGKGFYFDGAVQGGYNSYDSHRSALEGSAHWNSDGGELSVLAGTGYDWKIGGLTFGPTANFEYTYVGISGSAESGSLAPLDIPGQHQDSIRTTVGVKATYDWKLGNVLVRPELRVGWQHEYGSTAFDLSSSLANGSSPEFMVQGPDTGRDSLIVNCGFAVQWSERVSAYVYYDGELARTNYSAHSVSGGFRIEF